MIKIKYKIIKFSKLYLKDIWKIRNLKDSRKFSTSKNKIDYDSHLKWYKKLNKNKNKIFIILNRSSNKVIGYVRYHIFGKSAGTSIALNKRYQGKGLSKKILNKTDNKLKNFKLFSYVNIKNDKSIFLFLSAGYSIVSTYKKKFFKMKKNNNKNYLKIINQIESIRKKNNKNWMDILRIAFKYNPKEAAKIMSDIYRHDNKIGKLSKKF